MQFDMQLPPRPFTNSVLNTKTVVMTKGLEKPLLADLLDFPLQKMLISE